MALYIQIKIMARSQIPLVLKSSSEQKTVLMRMVERIMGKPLGDLGDPEDIAEAAAFLASSRSSYMTGSCLDVNGGLL